MRLFKITCGLLLLASYVLAIPRSKSTSSQIEEPANHNYHAEEPSSLENHSDDESSLPNNHRKQTDDEVDLLNDFNMGLENEQLPILPPIILLDFVNGTDNSTGSEDGKFKRTVESSYGFGFNQNSLFSGKHNFYFPAGKTGTAVSIEESISPIPPMTVTEIIKPITDKPETKTGQDKGKQQQTLFEALPDPLPLANGEPTPVYPPYPVFGQRTKLQKTSSPDFGPQQGRYITKQFSSAYTTAATPASDEYNRLHPVHTSIRPAGYGSVTGTGSSSYTSSANINGYARPMTSPFLANYMADIYSSSSNQKPSYDQRPSPTSASTNQQYNFANYPRYTIENGIKYEHKIVWKYPDGKISETPPMSYVNTYSEYAEQQRLQGAASGGFRPSTPYQSRPITSQQSQNTQGTSYNPYTSSSQNNIYSQRPVQFPNDQEQPNTNQPKEPTRFISSASASGLPGNYYDNANAYNQATYQGQYGLKQHPKPTTGYRVETNHKGQYSTYANHRPVHKYAVNSPETEYAYRGESGQTENLFSPDGQINKQVLSKYTPEAQQYLLKVFAAGKTAQKQEYQTSEPGSYQNTDYSHLLNYNPSISQYIKNPSSILKAQPTFIQAGNSLIPVIILRVDGAPPIQPATGSNINLKALLRQYLLQYANSVSKVTQNSNYNLGDVVEDENVSSYSPNPIEDLKQFTDGLSSIRQQQVQQEQHLTSGTYTRTYPQQPQVVQTQQQSSSAGLKDYSSMNYNGFIKDYQKIHAAQAVRKPQKIKSVQIIEDPRYTSYKVDNN